jgi:hypothetical protein
MAAVVIAQIWRGCSYAEKPRWRQYTAQNRLSGDEVAREPRIKPGIDLKGLIGALSILNGDRYSLKLTGASPPPISMDIVNFHSGQHRRTFSSRVCW